MIESPPSGGAPSASGQDESSASQVVVNTGMLTIALPTPPLAQVSAVPSPTLMVISPELSTKEAQDCVVAHVPPAKLVSPFSSTVRSDPPSESMTPTPQPV